MKLESSINKLLTNKIVLYIVSVIAILNVLGYLFYGNNEAVLYFVILAGLVYYFSKNMIIVFLVPLILVNLFVGSQMNTTQTNKEGMKSGDTDTSTPQQNEESSPTVQENQEPLPETTVSLEPSSSEAFNNKKGTHKLDYSGTLADTYNHLNNILGSEGMKSLTTDTKELMEQQKQLAESMKNLEPVINSFGPLIKQAEGLLGGLNGSGGAKGLEGLNEMIKKMGGAKQE
jgi:uncharacterized membrane protein